ncbi:MAG: hypothetical protein RR472_04210, partial [Anaerovoracaceae bacterium]
VTVMFAAYLGLLGLFYTYRTLLRGTALLIKREDPVLARGCMRAWKPACGIVILTMILIPISAMMPRIVEYIATGVLACLGLLAQGYMCKLLLDGKTTLDDARM